VKRPAGVVAFFALLACVALYNPILHVTTHLPGTASQPVTDFFHFHWNYWWIRHALTTPGLNVYETNYVMAPYTSSLAYHTLTPFWFPIWALIEPLAGTVTAMTVIFVVAMTLAGSAFYALLRHEHVSSALALVGGAMLMLSPMFFNGVFWTNVNLMGWFWLPVLVLIWDWIARTAASGAWMPSSGVFTPPPGPLPARGEGEPPGVSSPSPFTGKDLGRGKLGLSPRSTLPFFPALILALAFWGVILVDLQYALFAAFIIGPYGLLTLWTAGNRAARLRLIVSGLLAVGIALILLWVVGPLPYILRFDRSVLAATPARDAVSIRFPAGYVWRLTDVWVPVSLGALLLPLLAMALLLNLNARRTHVALAARRWFWLALVPTPLILSAGATITAGGVAIPLPYRLLHALFGGMFRYPERFAPVLLIPAVIFIMQTLTPLLAGSRWRKAIPVVLLAAVMVDSRMFSPFPIQPIPTPYHFYEVMGREPYDYVVVEVPTGISTGESLVGEPIYAALQYYGITHGKRMINGHLSRVDPAHFWYLRTDDPLLSWLGQRIFLDPARAESRLREIIWDYPVGYIVVHSDLILRYTGRSTVQEVIGYLNRLPDLLCPVFVEGPAVVYRTAWHPDGCPPRTPPEIAPGVYQIDVGSSGDEPYLGWGWHWQEEIVPGLTARWTGQFPQADVYAQLPPGEYRVTLETQAYQQARTLRLDVNGVKVGETTITPDSLQAVTFDIPAALTADGGFLTLRLDYGEAEPVEGAGRSLALLVDWIQFTRK
jgi:hypothetical protein